MGIRFRKRVKVLPGVTLNFSKSGISTTIGTRGASVNIGKNGVYGNAGIPGTGIYMREKIAGSKKSKAKKSTRNTYTNIDTPISTQTGIPESNAPATDNFSFGCMTVVVSIIFGIFFAWGLGNIKLTFVIAPVVMLLVFITRFAKEQNKEDDKPQSATTERVLLDELLQYKSVTDEETFKQLLEYKKMGAVHVNIPIGTLDKLKQMKADEKAKHEKELSELQQSDGTTTPGSMEEYKKNALLAEFEKDYEKASENWMQYLNETMKSKRELEDEVLERTLSCFRKTTNLQREFFMYEDLIAHYPDHPKRSEWENERNELERIIRAQEK